jgi:FkbM family methyltransferase
LAECDVVIAQANSKNLQLYPDKLKIVIDHCKEKTQRINQTTVCKNSTNAVTDFLSEFESLFGESAEIDCGEKSQDVNAKRLCYTKEQLLKGVYIRGSGVLGQQTRNELKIAGIPFLGFLKEDSIIDNLESNFVIVAVSGFFRQISDEIENHNGVPLHLNDFYKILPELGYPEIHFQEWLDRSNIELFFLAASLTDKLSLIILANIVQYRRFGLSSKLLESRNLSGEQWFEFVERQNTVKVFVDGGAYDGDTIHRFIQRNPIYRSIYAYEMIPQFLSKARKTLLHQKNIYFRQYALSSNSGELTVSKGSLMNSKVSTDEYAEKITVNCTSLDLDVKEQIDFLKLDLEGHEEKALLGAKNHLISDRPRIACAVYHKVNDLIDLPNVIAAYAGPHFAHLRHYTEFSFETVYYSEPTQS